MGHAFLRHIERTQALAFVIDLSSGPEPGAPPSAPGGGPAGAELLPWETLAMLHRELEMYGRNLLGIPAIVVANKVDRLVEPEERLAKLRYAFECDEASINIQMSVSWEEAQMYASDLSASDAWAMAGIHATHFAIVYLLIFDRTWPSTGLDWLIDVM